MASQRTNAGFHVKFNNMERTHKIMTDELPNAPMAHTSHPLALRHP